MILYSTPTGDCTKAENDARHERFLAIARAELGLLNNATAAQVIAAYRARNAIWTTCDDPEPKTTADERRADQFAQANDYRRKTEGV